MKEWSIWFLHSPRIRSCKGCNSITCGALAAFSKLLCDTSSVEKTFRSNHTLQALFPASLTLGPFFSEYLMTSGLELSLMRNHDDDKMKVAIIKILQNHNDFDMTPFFEWDLKVLPLVINWLELASDYPTPFEKDIRRRKLSTIYQYIRAMPLLYIEAYNTVGVQTRSRQQQAFSTPQMQCDQ